MNEPVANRFEYFTRQSRHVLVTVAATLSSCSLGPRTTAAGRPADFDRLARQVPNNAEIPLFLDLKPEGEVERLWTQIRQRLEAEHEEERARLFVDRAQTSLFDDEEMATEELPRP